MNQSMLNRRGTLKIVGGTLVGFSGTAAGKSENGANKYVGLAYDPKSHEIMGQISGKLTENRGRINGSLKFDDMVVKFNNNKRSSENNRATKEGVEKQKRYMTKKSHPNKPNKHTKVKVTSITNSGLTGVVQHPEKDKMAFSINKSNKSALSEVEEILKETAPKKTETY